MSYGNLKAFGQSPRHKWKTYNDKGSIDKCERCGRMFSYLSGEQHGPVQCFPTAEWLKNHPEDDGKPR